MASIILKGGIRHLFKLEEIAHDPVRMKYRVTRKRVPRFITGLTGTFPGLPTLDPGKSKDQRKPSGSTTSRYLFPPNKTPRTNPTGNRRTKIVVGGANLKN